MGTKEIDFQKLKEVCKSLNQDENLVGNPIAIAKVGKDRLLKSFITKVQLMASRDIAMNEDVVDFYHEFIKGNKAVKPIVKNVKEYKRQPKNSVVEAYIKLCIENGMVVDHLKFDTELKKTFEYKPSTLYHIKANMKHLSRVMASQGYKIIKK